MSRLLEDLRDGRQDIVDDAATFGVDFRADGHARFKAKGPTVDGDFRGLQLDPGNVVKLCGSRDSVRLLASLSARNAGWVLQVCGSANGDGIVRHCGHGSGECPITREWEGIRLHHNGDPPPSKLR